MLRVIWKRGRKTGSNPQVCGALLKLVSICQAEIAKSRRSESEFLTTDITDARRSGRYPRYPRNLWVKAVERLAVKNMRSQKNGNGSTQGRALLRSVFWGRQGLAPSRLSNATGLYPVLKTQHSKSQRLFFLLGPSKAVSSGVTVVNRLRQFSSCLVRSK
jgi:hypothetical protein